MKMSLKEADKTIKMTVAQFTCANNTPTWNNVIQQVEKRMLGPPTIRPWPWDPTVLKRPFGPWKFGPHCPRPVRLGLNCLGPNCPVLNYPGTFSNPCCWFRWTTGRKTTGTTTTCSRWIPRCPAWTAPWLGWLRSGSTASIPSTTKIWQGNNSNSFYYLNLTRWTVRIGRDIKKNVPDPPL